MTHRFVRTYQTSAASRQHSTGSGATSSSTSTCPSSTGWYGVHTFTLLCQLNTQQLSIKTRLQDFSVLAILKKNGTRLSYFLL